MFKLFLSVLICTTAGLPVLAIIAASRAISPQLRLLGYATGIFIPVVLHVLIARYAIAAYQFEFFSDDDTAGLTATIYTVIVALTGLTLWHVEFSTEARAYRLRRRQQAWRQTRRHARRF